MTSKEKRIVLALKALSKGQTNFTFEYSPQNIYACTIKTLFSEHLNSSYPNINYQQLYEDFDEFLGMPRQVLGRKSNSVLLGKSRKYLMKQIDDDTISKMEECFEELLQFKEHHSNNYIVDIFRVFEVSAIKENYEKKNIYILMPSLRVNFQEIYAIYDVKGYVDSGRTIAADEYKIFKFGKDGNFVDSPYLQLLQLLSYQTKVNLVKDITYSFNFFQERNIIDYSILFSFRQNHPKQNPSYFQYQISEKVLMEIQIIDYFQQFNLKKKIQNKFKTLFTKGVSSVQPNQYIERFVEFLNKYFLK